eukprot:COSAG01_NODE_3110_length_6571_cov_218.696539_11_plen_71_part_00
MGWALTDAQRLRACVYVYIIQVELTLNFEDVLRRDTARAWKLQPHTPTLTLSLEMQRDMYTDTLRIPEQK